MAGGRRLQVSGTEAISGLSLLWPFLRALPPLSSAWVWLNTALPARGMKGLPVHLPTIS